MIQQKFDHAAKWVHQRQNITMSNPAQEPEIAEAIATLCNLAEKCHAAVMIPDLFPGSALETIYIPPDGGDNVSVGGGSQFLGASRITIPALSAIGVALVSELESTGNDMVLCDLDQGGQAIAYMPEVRNTVLQSTGLVLLNN